MTVMLDRQGNRAAIALQAYSVFADEAVALLRINGYAAGHLQEGVAERRYLGLPVMKEETQRKETA